MSDIRGSGYGESHDWSDSNDEATVDAAIRELAFEHAVWKSEEEC